MSTERTWRARLAGITPRGPASLLGGVLALAFAGAGEWVIRKGNTSGLGLLLYLFGILAFSLGAWPLPRENGDVRPTRLRRRRVVLMLGVGAAVAANVAALSVLSRDERSPTAVRLWLLSLALLLAGGAAAGEAGSWAPRWPCARWPASRLKRAVTGAAVAAILLVAALTRFVALDRVPFGINADEGDRAAISIQMLRGVYGRSLFDVGWYHITNVYFWTLARFMEHFGLNFAGARMLGATAGFVTVAALLVLAVRHFGWRAGLFTGALFSVLGVALMFSRETTEAGPTATLWTISAAFFLEAVRRGRAWAWIAAGLAGGMGLYFYPTGRLWVIMAALFSAYLLFRGLNGISRRHILRGVALAALASFCAVSPYLFMMSRAPGEFTIRARETTIFLRENPLRLPYYHAEWSLPRLLAAQVDRSVGIFNRFPDANFFWPTDRPILPPLLAVFALVGLGATALKWRDPRLVLLTLWFWTGFVGVIVTVETPALQRMASAVPVIALFAGLVLDDLVRRVEESTEEAGDRHWRRWAATGVAALVVLRVMTAETRFFFGENARARYWPYPNAEGEAVARLGNAAWALSLGGMFHMLNSGWVRLLAPNAHRGGVLAPGSALPLPLPAVRDVAFFVYPRQAYYLPYLKEIYPGGAVTRVTHEPDVQVLDVYRVPLASWRLTRGALAVPSGRAPVLVSRLGDPPPGLDRMPSRMRWSAWLRVPRYWNYSFRIGPGPGRLAIDGVDVLVVRPGESSATKTVNLVRGDHEVVYEGLLRKAEPALFEWAVAGLRDPKEAQIAPLWERPPPSILTAALGRPHGLLGVIRAEAHPEQRRLDGAVATGGLVDEALCGDDFTVTWTGTLQVPEAGHWGFSFFTHGGTVELRVDGKALLKTEGDHEHLSEFTRELGAGPHALELVYHVVHRPGAIEWAWTPPGGSPSIVPPSALTPPPGSTLAAERPIEDLGPVLLQPRQRPMDLVP